MSATPEVTLPDLPETTGSAGGSSPSRSRWLWVWAAVCVVCVVAAFVVGRFVRSPWDDAVANSHASPAVVAAVEVRTFAPPTVEVPGTASAGKVVTVAPPQGGETGRVVVTANHAVAGGQLVPGQVLVEVSGRPIIALALPFPLYRDLRPGDSGADVRALQESLRALGFFGTTVDGTYGKGTADAVAALYRSVSMAPPPAPTETVTALAEARGALTDAQKAAKEAAPGSAPVDLAPLRAAVTAAEFAAATPLPMGEIQNVGADGAQVVSVLGVGAQPGEDASSVATLRSGTLTVSARVPVKDAESFAVGAAVQIVPLTNQTAVAGGVVSAVSEFRMSDEKSQLPGYDVTVDFDASANPPVGDEDSVLLRLPGAEEPIEGLAVPLVAVREHDEHAFVVLVRGKVTEEIAVETSMSADGYALVTGELAEGDSVLVSGTP